MPTKGNSQKVFPTEFKISVYEQLHKIADQEVEKALTKMQRTVGDEETQPYIDIKGTLVLFKLLYLTESFGIFGDDLRIMAIRDIMDGNLGNKLINSQLIHEKIAVILGTPYSWFSDYRDLTTNVFNNLPDKSEASINRYIKIYPSNFRDIVPLLKALFGKESSSINVNSSLNRIKEEAISQMPSELRNNQEEIKKATVNYILKLGSTKNNRELRTELLRPPQK